MSQQRRMLTKTLVGRVRLARRRLKWSARELDRRAGLAQGHTAVIEATDKKRIEVRTVVRLADALGVSLDWLIRGGPGPAPTNPIELSPKPARRKRVAVEASAVPPKTDTDEE